MAYAATLARTVTRWDSGEFLAAVHSLGIPHPPGTPLYVLLARVWAMLPLPVPFAVRVNLFSAFCAAVAVTLLGVLVRRWTGDRVAGVAAVLCAGGTATLWLAATEAEVYAPALLFAVLLLFAAETARDGDRRKLVLLAFAAGLSWTVHPAALVTLPAAALLAFTSRAVLLRALPAMVAAAALGLSVVLYLLVRAQHDPVINQGSPAAFAALWDVLTRAQYADPGFWPRQAPLWLQLGNWFEYADWQFALGLALDAPPSWRRTPITIAFALLGVAGFLAHRRLERRSWRALTVAFLAATVGFILYLNLKAGPTFGWGILPDEAVREARERDYFFIASFALWGAWAGLGAVVTARWLARTRGVPAVVPLAVVVSAAPLLLNVQVAYEQRAAASIATRAAARAMLGAVPPQGVFISVGDNDTYPLWYLQVVEGFRTDVTVVTVPLLSARWYREELARRHALLDDPTLVRGTSEWLAEVCMRTRAQSRSVTVSPLWQGNSHSASGVSGPGETMHARRAC